MGYQKVTWPSKVLWVTTVGYPSDSLASCFRLPTWRHNLHIATGRSAAMCFKFISAGFRPGILGRSHKSVQINFRHCVQEAELICLAASLCAEASLIISWSAAVASVVECIKSSIRAICVHADSPSMTRDVRVLVWTAKCGWLPQLLVLTEAKEQLEWTTGKDRLI